MLSEVMEAERQIRSGIANDGVSKKPEVPGISETPQTETGAARATVGEISPGIGATLREAADDPAEPSQAGAGLWS